MLQLPMCWAKSTRALYNKYLNECYSFCVAKDKTFPPTHTGPIADFLCYLADKSDRPQSVLHSSVAALSNMYQGLGLPDLTKTDVVQKLVSALIKSGTLQPRQQTKVMPIRPFRDLFHSWPDNSQLTIQQLRLKAITLLALTYMLCPSDNAPKGETFSLEQLTTEPIIFSTKDVCFLEDGSLSIQYHGTKNDTDRAGFVVTVGPAQDPTMDPVSCLKTYMSLTQDIRPRDTQPVFLTLHRPYRAITAATVGLILSKAIELAGLKDQGYSAKCFRPTAATLAVENGCDPDIAMYIGRWKTRSVFFEHYVHCKAPKGFTQDIMSHD